MGRLLLIDALGAAVLLLLWYFWFVRFNRKKGVGALRLVEGACSGRGSITEARWCSGNRVQARLRFASRWVEDARVIVNLLPRHIPLQWLLAIWRKKKETLTFEADLDCPPGMQLQIYRHRWLTHHNLRLGTDSREWTLSRPGPVVLTTRRQWSQEIAPLVNAVMSSQAHNLVSVKLRSKSPHLSATVALEALSDQQASAEFLNVVKNLAAGASASRQ